jgi:hypothetical protein
VPPVDESAPVATAASIGLAAPSISSPADAPSTPGVAHASSPTGADHDDDRRRPEPERLADDAAGAHARAGGDG